MIRLVALDVDGTIRCGGRISERVRRAVAATRRAGVKVTLATGRRLSAAVGFARELGIDVPLILHDGALVYDHVREEIVRATHLPGEVARHLLRRSRELGLAGFLHENAHCGQRVYYDAEWAREAFDLFYSRSDDNFALVKDLSALCDLDPLRLIMFGDPAAVEEMYRLAAEIGGHRMLRWRDLHLHTLEFFAPDATKAEGVRTVADLLGVPYEAVMTIGDQQNDLEMLRDFPYGVAMETAPEEVKRQARYVTAPCEQDGAALALERFIDGVREAL